MAHLMLNLPNGSVGFDFNLAAAEDLRSHLTALMDQLKVVASAGGTKVSPQKNLDYHNQGSVFFEIFCNPNLYPSPFAAKVLITIKHPEFRLSTEADFSQIIEDVDQYLAAMRS